MGNVHRSVPSNRFTIDFFRAAIGSAPGKIKNKGRIIKCGNAMRTKLAMRWHPSFALRHCLVFFRFESSRKSYTGSKCKRDQFTSHTQAQETHSSIYWRRPQRIAIEPNFLRRSKQTSAMKCIWCGERWQVTQPTSYKSMRSFSRLRAQTTDSKNQPHHYFSRLLHCERRQRNG